MSESDRNSSGFRPPSETATVDYIRLEVITRMRDLGFPINKAFNCAEKVADVVRFEIEKYPLRRA